MTQPERVFAAANALLKYIQEHDGWNDPVLNELEHNLSAAILDTP